MTTTPPRIFDCFTFSTELDLLEFRLSLLAATVHRFVIVEAPRTHSGQPKPLLFDENKVRFAPYLDQIVHVIVNDIPAPEPDRWIVEMFQRDAIIRGLGDAGPDDIIVVSDVDEIPDPDVLEALRQTTFDSVQLRLRSCDYKGNWEGPDPWPLTKAVRMKHLTSPSELRLQSETLLVADAGAHFSYLMNPELVAAKYSSFAHAELDSPRQRSEKHLSSMMRLGVFAPSGRLLSVVAAENLSPVQKHLRAARPQHFDFTPPPRWIRRLGVTWSRARSRRSAPSGLVRLGDYCFAACLDLLFRRRAVARS